MFDIYLPSFCLVWHCIQTVGYMQPRRLERPADREWTRPNKLVSMSGSLDPVPPMPPRKEVGIMLPIIMSVIAGLATSLGASAIFCMATLPSPSQLAFTMGLAAGVMITVSIFELFLPVWWDYGFTAMATSALAGAVLFLALGALMERLACCATVPEPMAESGEVTVTAQLDAARKEAGGVERMKLVEMGLAQGLQQNVPRSSARGKPPLLRAGSLSSNLGLNSVPGAGQGANAHRQRQWRVGILMMVALTAHNFPEGLAVAASAMTSKRLGVVMTVAIGCHNIPEGLTIATPIFAATGDKWRAFWMATLSGLSEPLGALTALLFLRPYTTAHPQVLSYVTCAVGGIMVAVAVKELIPEALEYERPRAMWNGILAGSLVMAFTMLVDV